MSIERRTLVKGALWSAPVVVAAGSIPAYAASTETTIPTDIEYGLFVSAQNNAGYYGYNAANNSVTGAATPSDYYTAKKAGNAPEADMNWDDSSNSATTTGYSNGEGDFTPAGNSTNAGTYSSGTGFWFSVPVPTSSKETGSGYLAGTTATLVKGAQFSTIVEFTAKKGAITSTSVYVTDSGTPTRSNSTSSWYGQSVSGNNTATSSSKSTYLSTVHTPTTWTAATPTITDNGDGTETFRGVITLTTAQDITLTQSGSKYYAQTFILPSAIKINVAVSKLTLTSTVDAAVFTYSGLSSDYSSPTTTSISGLTESASIS